MKKLWLLGTGLLILTVAVGGVHTFLMPLPDGVVRLNGLVMLAALAVTVYSAVKRRAEKG